MNSNFNKENPVGIVICLSCNTPLWRMKILSSFGNSILSTEMTRFSKNIPNYNKTELCPVCNRKFYKDTQGDKKFKMRSELTGKVFFT